MIIWDVMSLSLVILYDDAMGQRQILSCYFDPLFRYTAAPSVIRCRLQALVSKQFTYFEVGRFISLEIYNILTVSVLYKMLFCGTLSQIPIVNGKRDGKVS